VVTCALLSPLQDIRWRVDQVPIEFRLARSYTNESELQYFRPSVNSGNKRNKASFIVDNMEKLMQFLTFNLNLDGLNVVPFLSLLLSYIDTDNLVANATRANVLVPFLLHNAQIGVTHLPTWFRHVSATYLWDKKIFNAKKNKEDVNRLYERLGVQL